MKNKAIFNWSGGKDSALALHYLRLQNNLEVKTLLTSINESYGRISMHGVRQELLEQQAASIGLPLKKLLLPEAPTMEEYNTIMGNIMADLKQDGYTDSIFGDIFLENLRKYRENQLAAVGFKAHFPLWGRDTKELIMEFIDAGFKTIVVCVKSEVLDKSFAGRVIDKQFVKDLPANVDPCGENGEFHTFVFDGPIFEKPVQFKKGDLVFREYKAPKKDEDTCGNTTSVPSMGFWFCDLIQN